MSGGLKFDQNKPDYSLLPKAFLDGTAEGLMYGVKKYGKFNFRKGLEHTRMASACMRHVVAYLAGEDLDPESGIHHLKLASCNLAMLLDSIDNKNGIDDRYKGSIMFNFILLVVLSGANAALAHKTGLHWGLAVFYAILMYIGYGLVFSGLFAKVFYLVPKDSIDYELIKKHLKKGGEE